MTRSRAMKSGRNAVAWLALACCAGVILGVAGRVAMRIVALEGNGDTGFSVGGSLEVVAFGMIVGAPAAAVYWGCRRWRPLPHGAGMAFGLLLFVILASVPPPAARSALDATPDTPIVTGFVFAAAFVVYGAILDLLWQRMTSR